MIFSFSSLRWCPLLCPSTRCFFRSSRWRHGFYLASKSRVLCRVWLCHRYFHKARILSGRKDFSAFFSVLFSAGLLASSFFSHLNDDGAFMTLRPPQTGSSIWLFLSSYFVLLWKWYQNHKYLSYFVHFVVCSSTKFRGTPM